MRLQDVVGHEAVIDALVRAHRSDTAHHAYLFMGPEGVGKLGVAHGFAALINCTGAPVPNVAAGSRPALACGNCYACRRMAGAPDHSTEQTADHPDLMRLQPDGKQIKIAQVREMIRVVPFPPIEARYRVVIIEPADAMGEEAANALLKTLEEPPSRTRFILITSRPGALLATIQSRCQRVLFSRLTDGQVESVLEAQASQVAGERPEREALLAAVRVADGSVGAAAALLNDPVMANRDTIVTRLMAVPAGDMGAAFALAVDLADLGGKGTTVLNLLERFYRDALLLRSGTDQPIFNSAVERQLRQWVVSYGIDALLARLELIGETRLALGTFNTNLRLSMERLVAALTAPAGGERTVSVLPHLAIL